MIPGASIFESSLTIDTPTDSPLQWNSSFENPTSPVYKDFADKICKAVSIGMTTLITIMMIIMIVLRCFSTNAFFSRTTVCGLRFAVYR